MSTNQVATTQPQKTIDQWLRDPGLIQQFANALPQHITAERFARVALTTMTRVPKLRQCTIESLMRCLMDCSAMGLEPDGRRAHLIPFEDRKNGVTVCTLIVDYKGLVELCKRSGDVSGIHADVVCENDEFEYNMGQVTAHKINFRKPRGPVYAVYAVVELKDGTRQTAVLSREEVEAVRSRSKSSGNGPWVSDWGEMAKKTAFRRLSKWLVLSPEIRDAIEKDDEHESRVIETSSRQVIESSGNARLAAMLTPAPQQLDDGGPTAEDIAGTVDHSPDSGKKVDPLDSILTQIARATTAEAVDRIVADEQSAGGHSPEADRQIAGWGAARKAKIAEGAK